VHQMVVPPGFAILQLVPWLFVIVHKAILDVQFLAMHRSIRFPIANLPGTSGSSARSKRVSNSSKPVFANVSHASFSLRSPKYRLSSMKWIDESRQ
jgi:hypothetical protein